MANARQLLRTWLKTHVGDDDYEVDAVVEAACEQFMRDPKFLKAYAVETFGSFVRDVLGAIRHTNRMYALGESVVTEETFSSRVEDFQQRFAKWQEMAAPGRVVSLMHMTKTELLFAADRREVMGIENLRRAALCRTLATRLRKNETVADRWSSEELHDLYDRISVPESPAQVG